MSSCTFLIGPRGPTRPHRGVAASGFDLARKQRAASILGAVLAASLAGCHGEIVTIGEKPAPTYHFGPPRSGRRARDLRAHQQPDAHRRSARDLFHLHAATKATSTSGRRRARSRNDTFGPPQKVRSVSSGRFDTGSAVSADGLTLWLGSDRRIDGKFTRTAASTSGCRRAPRGPRIGAIPSSCLRLNSSSFDIPRPPGLYGLVMPLGSERGPGSVYRTFFASRASTTAPFETPQPVPEIVFEEATTMDTFLSNDGLTFVLRVGPVRHAERRRFSAAADAGAGSMADATTDATTPVLTADLYVRDVAKRSPTLSRVSRRSPTSTPCSTSAIRGSAKTKRSSFSRPIGVEI